MGMWNTNPDADEQEFERSEGRRGKPVKFTNKEINNKIKRVEKTNKLLKKSQSIKPTAK